MKYYDDNIVKEVWRRYVGTSRFKKDIAGAWMDYDKYGETKSCGEGWEIDHIKPVSDGGSDDITNLRPLQWENNRSKSDNYPRWESVVSSKGTTNIYRRQCWKIS